MTEAGAWCRCLLGPERTATNDIFSDMELLALIHVYTMAVYLSLYVHVPPCLLSVRPGSP